MKILVAGAGGFIGGHLCKALSQQGHHVVGADIKPLKLWYQPRVCMTTYPDCDLRRRDQADRVTIGVDHVYNLAADMGGMGFIELHKADCMLSVLINTNLLIAARKAKVARYFYASSACVYAADKQSDPNNPGLKEEDAYPAMPEDGYGWEKLFSERMCRHFMEDFGFQCRVARLHNVYGPHGTWDGGREKAPAAICRKVIAAVNLKDPQIDIWGDGEQTRSFTWIDDCVIGMQKIMASDIREPLNLGSSEMVSINQLVTLVESIPGVSLKRTYTLNAPKGVRGRSSDNTRIKILLDWAPSTPLIEGLRKTYAWIEAEWHARLRQP